MQLRNLEIPVGAVFAPMAGLTDAACRHLMADHGAAWTVSEMASAKALNFHDEKSLALLRDKHPHGLYAIQLFGAEPESMAKAILFVREQGIRFDILDINMGCPAPKITGSGAGSKLLLDPPLCGQMVAAARRALGEDTPLTVKMRIGWDADHLTGVEVAKQLEANGADLIAVHGRTREQMYIPPIDTAAIAAIKQAVSVPVLANGDVTTADEALTLLEATGCDGVMIGRGALGDPWLFAQVRAALLGEERPPEPTLNQRMTALRDQIYEMCEEKGEWAAMPQARSQAMHYMKGLHGAAALRRYCSMLEHFSDVDTQIEAVYRAAANSRLPPRSSSMHLMTAESRSAAFKILRSASFSTLPVSQTWVSACNSSGCRLAITRALSCSTALYAVRRASFLYLTGVGMSPVRISGASW